MSTCTKPHHHKTRCCLEDLDGIVFSRVGNAPGLPRRWCDGSPRIFDGVLRMLSDPHGPYRSTKACASYSLTSKLEMASDPSPKTYHARVREVHGGL